MTYPAADSLAGIVPEGSLKPEASFSTAVVEYTLDTLAHWIEATRQAVEDQARLRDVLTNGLLRGVRDKAEAEAAAAIQASDGDYQPVTGETMIQAVRRGIASVQSAGFTPSAVLLNPMDAAELDFLIFDKTGGPSVGSGVWGLPYVAAGAVPEGTVYVADWSVAVTWFFRASAEVFVTDSDVNSVDGSSNFKKNILTFLAEQRAKTVVTRPEAVAICSVAVPPVARQAAPAKAKA